MVGAFGCTHCEFVWSTAWLSVVVVVDDVLFGRGLVCCELSSISWVEWGRNLKGVG